MKKYKTGRYSSKFFYSHFKRWEFVKTFRINL